jgi:hypothetical protein
VDPVIRDPEHAQGLVLTIDLRLLISKVQTIVKIFRKSPTKSNIDLAKYTKEEFGSELSLCLDTKTRFNSLLAMLERLLQLKNCVQKALIDFTAADFDAIADVVCILEPVEVCVEAPCSHDRSSVACVQVVQHPTLQQEEFGLKT